MCYYFLDRLFYLSIKKPLEYIDQCFFDVTHFLLGLVHIDFEAMFDFIVLRVSFSSNFNIYFFISFIFFTDFKVMFYFIVQLIMFCLLY